MLSLTSPSYEVKLGFISDSRETPKLTSPFGVISQMWLALFPGSLQFVTPRSHIGKKRNSPHSVGDLQTESSVLSPTSPSY